MTFATRIALAMAGTVLVAMAIVAVAGGSRVRRSYIDALRGSLEARIDAVAQSQSDIRAQAKAEVERLVRSPRLVATMLAGDSDALRKTAADELRDIEKSFNVEWVEQALLESVLQNKRSLKYVRAILERRHKAGREPHGENGERYKDWLR